MLSILWSVSYVNGGLSSAMMIVAELHVNSLLIPEACCASLLLCTITEADLPLLVTVVSATGHHATSKERIQKRL